MAKKKWVKVGLWAIGFLIGFPFLLYVGLRIWTSTWASYAKYGISFRYPKTWKVVDIYNLDKAKSREDLLLITDSSAAEIPGVGGYESNINKMTISRFSKRGLGKSINEIISDERVSWPGKVLPLSYYNLGDKKIIRDTSVYYGDWIIIYWVDTSDYFYKITSDSNNINKYLPLNSVWFNIISSRIVKSLDFKIKK